MTQHLALSTQHSALLFCCLFAVGCNSAIDDEVTKRTQVLSSTFTMDPDFYNHPMVSASVAGRVVLHEAKGPNLQTRYAVGDMVTNSGEGIPTLFSGVTVQSVAREPSGSPEKSTVPTGHPPVRFGETLTKWLANGPEGDRLIYVSLIRPTTSISPYDQFERRIAMNPLMTRDGANVIRQEIMQNHQQVVSQRQQELLPSILESGVRVLSLCRNSYCLLVEASKSQASQLGNLLEIRRMDFADQIADENTVGGIDVLAGAQIGQFADNGFDGFVFPNPINVGVVEYGAFSTTHVGFRDDSSTSRIVSMRNCTGGTCSTVTTFGTPATHATMTSGLLAGDLMDGQDSTVTTTDGRRDRSGYGREAALHMWRANNTTNLPTSLSDAVSSMLPILNMSVAYAGNTNCSGQSVTDEIINDLFEAGTVTFFAAGNNGHSSTTDCVVEEPGSALGAFVVGAHDSADEADVRGGAIESFSDRGGTTDEGFRSIIDLTAAGCRLNGFTTGGGYGPTGCGTSVAAPTVAGAAADFVDWYKTVYGNGIDDPTSLTANMLLMGDREGETSRLTSGFSNLWGAGRQKMRKFDGDGLDGPYQWGSLWTCIDQGEAFYQMLNGGNLISSDVDALKAVVFYFDRRHEDGTMDDIDLSLQRSVDKVNWTTVRQSRSGFEEKERVFHNDFSGPYYWRLRIHGFSVTADQTVCGTNSMKVRYAWFFEDSDRETAEGLDDIDTED